jgi:predicted amidohydrolase YtcJ
MAGAAGFAQQTASLILTNGKVVTLDKARPQAQAVAIAADRIVAVGSGRQVLKFRGKHTRVVDLKGRTVIPGLYDSHLHVIRGGRFYNLELRWDGVKSLRRALEMLREQAARTPRGQWVRVVGGWNEYQFEERRKPTLAEINEATGDVPTFVLYLYGEAYLNRAGLKALNINGETANPPGGLIERDESGAPTGLLVAEPNAFILYSTLAKLPEMSFTDRVNSTKHYMAELNRLGVTAVMDAGGGFQNFPDDYVITDTLARRGQLTLRIPYYLFAQKSGQELADYTRWVNMINIGQQNLEDMPTEYFVSGGGENLLLKAADFENFDHPRPELDADMEEKLKPIIQLLVKNRWNFRLHATYNESITRFLNVIEQVNRQTPLNGLRWFFDHAETVSDANLQRIKALGGGVAIQHRMAYQGEKFKMRYGKWMTGQAPPVRKLLDLGLPVGMGTDGTRVASYNPWVGLYWLTTGKTVGGLKVMSDENIPDRTTALELFTVGSARLIGTEKDRGRIQPGHLADLAVLTDDYLTVDGEKIKDIQAVMTVLDGKVVYGTGEFAPLAPKLPDISPAWSPVKYYGGYQYK